MLCSEATEIYYMELNVYYIVHSSGYKVYDFFRNISCGRSLPSNGVRQLLLFLYLILLLLLLLLLLH